MTYCIGMRGVKGDKVSDLKSLIFNVLADIVATGFHSDDIAAAINSLEFSVRSLSSLYLSFFSSTDFFPLCL
jgi:Zn-dependent M16 (insulinase) family peptidase